MEDKRKETCQLELNTKTTDSALTGTSSINLIDDTDEDDNIDSKPAATGKPRTASTLKSSKSDDKPVLGTARAEHRYKMWLRGELVGVAVLVIIIWGLFLLPIIVYHLPVSNSDSSSNNTTSVGETCSPVITYDGSVCRQELSALTSCLPVTEQDGVIYIQRDESNNIGQLLSALQSPLLGASDECKAAALPFLCVYFFGLCDSTGRAYTPSSSQCTEISTEVCAREWMLASNFPGVTLPECSSFPDETMLMESCNSTTQTDGMLSNPTESSESLNQTCTCREGFYCKNGSNDQCFPQCSSWKQYTNTESIIIDAVTIVAAVIGIVSATAVLIIAGVRWKKVFTFPSMFVVYETITLLIMAFFVVITYFDRPGLYCSSRDLQDSLLHATPFCVISGMVFYYILIQLSVWWIVHVTALLWKIRFPFHAHRFESAHRVRYIHIICVILGLLVPLLPVIVTIADSVVDANRNSDLEQTGTLGFSLTRFPPILCTGIDRSSTYYSLALPLNLILIVGMTELVVIFWLIHKQHGLFKLKQSKNPFKIGTAERKILIVFCYYVLTAIISLIAFTISTRNGNRFAEEILKYFLCEQSNPSEPCSREKYEALTNPVLTSLSYILLGLFPLINLTYVINFEELKEKTRDGLCLHRQRQRQNTMASFVNDGPSSSSTASGVYTTKDNT